MEKSQRRTKGNVVSPQVAAAKEKNEPLLNTFSIVPVRVEYEEEIKNLLRAENLPTEDLASPLSNFFVAIDKDMVIGSIGLESFQTSGLLRSLVVKREYRNLKIAATLVSKVEEQGRSLGIKNLYLLTETARDYFIQKGYEPIYRSEAPVSISQTSEFTHVCPSSAILMIKNL